MTQESALTILKTGANVFLTGEPGAGKSYTVNEYVAYLRRHSIEPAITASTGIAATHIHGQTLHSWSGIGIRRILTPYDLDKIANTEYIARRIKKTKVLIIDEVSMIDAAMLDMVDAVCKEVRLSEEPFGGMQVILVGDFFQLPPIASPGSPASFAFLARVWSEMRIVTCYITEQHRQADEAFLSVLSAIRTGSYDLLHHETLKRRYKDASETITDPTVTQLFPHNENVDRINEAALAMLPGLPKQYPMISKGSSTMVASLQKGCLSPETLTVKIGSIVMCTKNSREKEYANGTLGTVTDFERGTGYPIIKTRDHRIITVEPVDWVIEEQGKIKASITQVPLRLAWAITIHKSQGMSLDAAVMDLRKVFEYGQGYVALSRVRSLDGLHLLGWNDRALMVHPQIIEQDRQFHSQSREAEAAFVDVPLADIKRMHENFIIAAGGTFPKKDAKGVEQKTPKKGKIDTTEVTLAMILEDKPIGLIAKERKLTAGTIMGHLEKLVDAKKMTYNQVLGLLTPTLIKALPDIGMTFDEYEVPQLTPVFEHYKGKYSYDELRLARLALQAQQKDQNVTLETI